VSAVSGDVCTQAGRHFRQVGSDRVASGGDIYVVAQDIAIVEDRTTLASQTEEKFRRSRRGSTAPCASRLAQMPPPVLRWCLPHLAHKQAREGGHVLVADGLDDLAQAQA
jgi:hypothetical protein